MGKARTRVEESKTQANRMRNASIARFAAQRKAKTTVQKIVFLNARSHPKGEGKGNKKGSAKANSVNAIDAADDETTVPAVLSTSQQQIDALKQVTANQGQVGNPQPPSAQNKKKPTKDHQAAVTSSGSNISFAAGDSPAKAVEKTKVQPVTPSPHNSVAAMQTTGHIMVDSGATTSLCQQNVISTSRGGPNMTQPKPKNCGPSMETLSTTRAKFKQQPRSLQRDRVGKPRWCRPFSEWKWNPLWHFAGFWTTQIATCIFFRSSSGKVWKKSREYPMVRFRAW